MTKLIREVNVSVSYGDVLASTTIPAGTDMPSGMREQLHKTIDSLADQLNLPTVATAAIGLAPQDRAVLESIAGHNRTTKEN